jgi:hypothetical protein
MVEPKFIYTLMGCIWVGQRFFTGGKTLVSSRREDLLVVGKGFTAVYSIVLRFQLIVTGRAKILLGVEFLLRNHMSEDIWLCKKVGYR